MTVTIREISNTDKKALKEFIFFPIRLYKGVEAYVPPVQDFELSTFSPKKNPAYEHSEARFWLAYQNEKIVGRIAGIIHGAEADQLKKIRFGWIDFIDDPAVSDALIETVSNWGKENNLTQIHGPLGFTDLDFEGMLISGFEEMATQATIYNFPYYQDHFEKLGFTKAVDWVESRIYVPDDLTPFYAKADRIGEKFGMRAKAFKSSKEILKYAQPVFELLNESYSHLYGYFPLTQKQIDYYIKQYFGFVKKDFVTMITNEADEVIGFAISFPSLSKAFKKAKGSMFPFGLIHILKAFFTNDTLDFFLVAVKKEYQRKGVHALLLSHLHKMCLKHGIKYVYSGQMLEDNHNINNLLTRYESTLDEEIRRRCFIREIG